MILVRVVSRRIDASCSSGLHFLILPTSPFLSYISSPSISTVCMFMIHRSRLEKMTCSNAISIYECT